MPELSLLPEKALSERHFDRRATSQLDQPCVSATIARRPPCQANMSSWPLSYFTRASASLHGFPEDSNKKNTTRASPCDENSYIADQPPRPFVTISKTMTDRSREKHAHLRLLESSASDEVGQTDDDGRTHEIQVTPLFSNRVRFAIEDGDLGEDGLATRNIFPQYGLLGLREATYGPDGTERLRSARQSRDEEMVYANMNAPWSAFICGSQGGGKSHTLSCLLENSLLSSAEIGSLPNPLRGIVFHYDRFTSWSSTQLCEAAYLCSAGIPVRVLVSPTNEREMRKLYTNLPNLPAHAPRPQVLPLKFLERHLNVTNIMTLMSFNENRHPPLYLEVLNQILREMAEKKKGGPGLDYQHFKNRLREQFFTREQTTPLNMRLALLEGFLDQSVCTNSPRSTPQENVWSPKAGTLTIVDMSCPFINANMACALFMICLGLFLEDRCEGGRVVALDEAHKVNIPCRADLSLALTLSSS